MLKSISIIIFHFNPVFCRNPIRNALDNCNGSMHSSHQRVVDAIALQGEIERLYVRFKNVELANKKIRAANNKKYYDFANYRTVRKIVQGIMDNLDVQMVSDQAITKSVEVQHLQSPDYWLTCVLRLTKDMLKKLLNLSIPMRSMILHMVLEKGTVPTTLNGIKSV